MDNLQRSISGGEFDPEFNNRAIDDLNLEELNVNITLQSALLKNHPGVAQAQLMQIPKKSSDGQFASEMENIEESKTMNINFMMGENSFEDIHTARRPNNDSTINNSNEDKEEDKQNNPFARNKQKLLNHKKDQPGTQMIINPDLNLEQNKDELDESQRMRIEINHRPVHHNYRKRKVDQNPKGQINKVLGPLKSKYQNDPKLIIYAERTPDKNQRNSPRKQKSMLKNTALKNSNGIDFKKLDNWSRERLSKERLNETVQSDEFLQNKLYTNTHNLKIDNVDPNGGLFISGDLDSNEYNGVHHEQFVKTTNSFYKNENLILQKSPKNGQNQILPPLKTIKRKKFIQPGGAGTQVIQTSSIERKQNIQIMPKSTYINSPNNALSSSMKRKKQFYSNKVNRQKNTSPELAPPFRPKNYSPSLKGGSSNSNGSSLERQVHKIGQRSQVPRKSNNPSMISSEIPNNRNQQKQMRGTHGPQGFYQNNNPIFFNSLKIKKDELMNQHPEVPHSPDQLRNAYVTNSFHNSIERVRSPLPEGKQVLVTHVGSKKRKPLITSRKVISSLNRSKDHNFTQGGEQSPYQMTNMQIAEQMKYKHINKKKQSNFQKEYHNRRSHTKAKDSPPDALENSGSIEYVRTHQKAQMMAPNSFKQKPIEIIDNEAQKNITDFDKEVPAEPTRPQTRGIGSSQNPREGSRRSRRQTRQSQRPANEAQDLGFDPPSEFGPSVPRKEYDIPIVPFREEPGQPDQLEAFRQSSRQASRQKRRGHQNSDFMGQIPSTSPNNQMMNVENPRYSFQEERPQTRGNQSHGRGTAAGGSRASQRQKRLPQKAIGNGALEALDIISQNNGSYIDQIQSSRGTDPTMKGKVFSDQGYQVTLPSSQGGVQTVLNPAQVNFAKGHQKFKQTDPLEIGNGLGGNGFQIPKKSEYPNR